MTKEEIKVGNDFYAVDSRGRLRHWYCIEVDMENGENIYCGCLFYLRKRKRPSLASVPISAMPTFGWFKANEIK